MTCKPSHLELSESAKYWRADDIGGVELLHARYISYSFARHTHEGAAIGVIEDGAESFYYRGAQHTATASQVVMFNPGEVHTGEGADSYGWRFRMFYLDAGLLQRAASEAAGRPRDVPFFPAAVLEDPVIATMLHNLHVYLEKSTSILERQSKFLWTFAQLALRHADNQPSLLPVRNEPAAVKIVRDYLEDHYTENVTLDAIARLANLSAYHLIRVFRSYVGLPPHAYLEQVRIHRAKAMLRSGAKILDTALSTGFTDQSHFSRHFKRMTGITPGAYAATAITYKTDVSRLPQTR